MDEELNSMIVDCACLYVVLRQAQFDSQSSVPWKSIPTFTDTVSFVVQQVRGRNKRLMYSDALDAVLKMPSGLLVYSNGRVFSQDKVTVQRGLQAAARINYDCRALRRLKTVYDL